MSKLYKYQGLLFLVLVISTKIYFLCNKTGCWCINYITYLQIYSAAGQYSSKGKPLAWILTITRNLSLMKIRERQKTVDLPPEEWKDSLTMLPNLTPEDRLVLENCIGQLTDEERQIVMLHAVSGFKHRELAEVLALPLSTVISKYSRAIKKLKQLLTEGEQ